MNPGWHRKLSTVITHVNYATMVAHIDPQQGFLHDVNTLECMRGKTGGGGFRVSVDGRLLFRLKATRARFSDLWWSLRVLQDFFTLVC